MSLVSVIIPNYNHAKYLIERIETVINQTYQHLELIILDDNSSDNSKEIIENYRNHPRLSEIIYNNSNSGSPFEQWAKGIMAAKGEYIWIAESDDWCELNFLDELMSYALKFPEASLIYADSFIMEDDKKHLMGPAIKEAFKYFEPNDLLRVRLMNGTSIYNGSAVIFKKSKALPYLNKLVDYKKHGDYYLWIMISLNESSVFVNKPLNYFRILKTSVTNRAQNNISTLKEHLEIFRILVVNKSILKQNNFFYNCWAIRFSKILNKLQLKNNLRAILDITLSVKLNIFFCIKLFYHLTKAK